ncbi:hypothetical protein Hamer_G016268 [Homarus americanus]|uniref:Uncharacterized protein n=1 Tax=Homarus americanus TaxID=6706 RepID=A0A8J5JXF6_HOMAM|nr:hypothetical protein Hamer_G016268 [Homarus americanus]
MVVAGKRRHYTTVSNTKSPPQAVSTSVSQPRLSPLTAPPRPPLRGTWCGAGHNLHHNSATEGGPAEWRVNTGRAARATISRRPGSFNGPSLLLTSPRL